jgi:hypothetical protein
MQSESKKLRDYEDKIGVDYLDEQHAERDAQGDEYATLWADFGPPDFADKERVALMAELNLEIRELWSGPLPESGKPWPKITDDSVKAAVHSHARYKKWIEDNKPRAKRYAILKEKIAKIEARIERGNAVIRYAAAEARLQ